MKAICKDYYRYTRDKDLLDLIWKSFSQDWVLRRIAANYKKIPVSILERLSDDEDWLIQYEVANHIRTPISVLLKFKDHKTSVISAVAQNHPTYIKYLNSQKA